MRGLVVVVAALLALAPAAHGDVTIGSDLTAESTDPIVITDAGGLTAAPVGATVPFAGVITRWRVRVGLVSTPIRLIVLRPSTGLEVVHSDPQPAPLAGSKSVYEVRMSVAQGDRIALECCAGPTAGIFFRAGAGTTDVWSPPIGPNPPAPNPQPVLTMLNADVEPDIDGDGNGDDTQDEDDDGDNVPDATDDCPTKPAATANGCPATPASPRVNTPPVVRFRTPASGTAVRAAQAIELDVADDAGNPTVSVFDDDGTICTVSAPPYSCTWNPTGADVGRATLLASAVDSDGRSTLGIVRVSVARFEADLTRRVRGRRVTGRLVLPAAVEKALGCRGEVTVRRGKTTRTVALKRNCTYSARVSRRGRVRARFGGNPVVEPAT